MRITGPYQAGIRCARTCLTGPDVETPIVLNLGPALMPDFATGAMFHAIMAWPTSEETASFHRVSEELMAETTRLTRRQNPELVADIKEDWPQLSWPSIEARAKKAKPALGYLDKRLKQRMAAARAAIGKMHAELFGIPVTLPPGLRSLAIDQLCRLIRSDVSIDDPENVEKFVWRTSLPIIHLAVATQLILAERLGGGAMFECNLQDVNFCREAVQLGHRLEQIVLDHPAIPISVDRMTRVRWVE